MTLKEKLDAYRYFPLTQVQKCCFNHIFNYIPLLYLYRKPNLLHQSVVLNQHASNTAERLQTLWIFAPLQAHSALCLHADT